MNAAQPTVLLIEDEAAQREVLCYNLAAEGYRVLQAASGDEGVLLARENVPDAIILDWMLPVMSGIEVCRQIKSNADTKDIPVIIPKKGGMWNILWRVTDKATVRRKRRLTVLAP